jgi:uncharacterized protein YndB with AHSA1/START domain
MPVTSITSSPADLRITAVGDYPVTVERLWQAWVDPRQLERFWGPPDYPATFTQHGFRVGGRSRYHLAGAEGTFHAWWRFEAIDPGRSFQVVEGFSDEHGTADPSMPTSRMVVSFESTATGSRVTTASTFTSLEALEAAIAMGALEGYRAALAQIDDLLASD